ncbi:papain family cysteine protease [Medicago truncatula]|uniref:Papain family cysteine protease n=1 Tax=Medicago truncatula TaxID=3880 RepID=A0A072VXS5_MEDTR|nr:papain family cysteine protease [Medicago truncatula]
MVEEGVESEDETEMKEIVPEDNWTTRRLKRILKKYGCLLGTFKCNDHKFHAYTSTLKIYHLSPQVASKQPQHCAMIVGCGSAKGQEYVVIQNSYGTTWGKTGFGRVSLELFDQIQVIRGVHWI